MKKSILLILTMSVTLFSLLAGNMNNQKIYSDESDVYRAIDSLYVMQGHARSSSSSPYTAAELLLMMEKIDRNTLSAAEQKYYDFIMSELAYVPAENNFIKFKFGFELAPELYIHSNTTDATFQDRDNWPYGYLKQNPMMSVPLETWPGENFYGYFELTIGNSLKPTESVFGSSVLNTNILGLATPLDGFAISELNMNFPYRAFGTAGGNMWTLQLGRDRVNWGHGVTGNFVVGDNLLYHNMVRFTTFGHNFKYTFLGSFFPHRMNYYDENGLKADTDQYTPLQGISMFMGHRLEWRFFKDRMNFTLTEGLMYSSEDGHLDLQIFNPFMLWHNLYTNVNTNSILSLEFDYTPVKNWNIYAAWVIDEFAIPGEAKPTDTDKAFPSAMGYMLGVKSVYALEKGMLSSNLEFAYTDPYLYLRGNGLYSDDAIANSDKNSGVYDINYVVAVRNYSQTDNMTYDEEFLGYKYGGDAIVTSLSTSFDTYEKWNIEGNIFYMAHGTHDKWTKWMKTNKAEDMSAPTDKHWSTNYKDPSAQSRNAVSHTLITGIAGEYRILDSLSVYGQLDFINIWNSGNISGRYTNDVQFTARLVYII